MVRRLTTTRNVVATVCCALSFAFAGCEKNAAQEGASTDPTAPEARMKDPVYRQQLADLNDARKPLLRARAQVLSEMEALREDVRQKLAGAGADAARVEAELAKRPAWAALTNRLAATEAALVAHRQRAAETIRARLAAPKAAAEKN